MGAVAQLIALSSGATISYRGINLEVHWYVPSLWMFVQVFPDDCRNLTGGHATETFHKPVYVSRIGIISHSQNQTVNYTRDIHDFSNFAFLEPIISIYEFCCELDFIGNA